MTQDEIIEMARQAKLGFLLESGFMCHQEVKDFAKLVAAKEREACAKRCEELEKAWVKAGLWKVTHEYKECSTAIRARGQA